MSIKNVVALLLTLLALSTLSSCITTIEGREHNPASPEERLNAHLNLGRGYLANRNYKGARAPLEKALAVDPGSAEAHVLMAILNEGESEPKLAESRYKRALRYEPNNAMALTNYGRFLHEQGQIEAALVKLRQASEISGYPGRPLAYQNLGLAELKAGNVSAAESAFQSCLRLDSSQLIATFELAEIYYEAQDYTSSRRYYDSYAGRVQQGARSLWLGIRLARRFQQADRLASYELALKNLFPASEEYSLYRESVN